MKISIKDVVNNVKNLKALQEVKFPVKISYRIMRIINRLQPILTAYEAKRNELVKEFGDEPDKEGNIKVTNPEKLKLFSEKLLELLDTYEDVEFEKIKIEDLDDVKVEPKLIIPFIFE